MAVKAPRVLQVTPKQAAEWLENNNENNRNILVHVVDKYTRDMLAEPTRWVYTGDPIQFDTEGNLLNGQHRLSAVVQSGKSQKFLIIEGLDRVAQDSMDANAVRTTGQQLQLHGIKNGPQTTAVIRLLLKWNTGSIARKASYSTAEVRDFLDENLSNINESMHWYYTIGGNIPLSRAAVGAFVFQLLELSQNNPEFTSQEDVMDFLGKMESGADLDPGHPILTLRNTVLRQRQSKVHRNAVRDTYSLVRTWNAYASGERYNKLLGPRDGVVMPSHLILKHMK